MTNIKLGFNLNYSELNNLEGLIKLDKIFQNFLYHHNTEALETLLKARINPHILYDKVYSDLLITLTPFIDDFFSELFNIEKEVLLIREKAEKFDLLYECKRKFVQRYAIKKYPKGKIQEINFYNISNLLEKYLKDSFSSQLFAKETLFWLNEPDKYSEELEIAAKYAAYKVYSGCDEMLFNLPKSIDPDNLISLDKITHYRQNFRLGFDYFEPELNSFNALNHAHYCIYCHNQGKDSCSKGLTNNDNEQKHGCPLKQKISEMNQVKALGFNIAALAIIVIDNPMVAATGHRICNDCMKSCIYQKQEPVNIPVIESNILENVLALPYGFEIYSLLTCWNPLNTHTPLPKAPTNYNILIVGLGPAGFSLGHYLLNEGHNVVAIDGLKILPLPFDSKLPIKYWNEYKECLSTRIPRGFGGVAEYGITSRWDKNNLTILRLILERRKNFKMFGGIRLESNINSLQAFQLGFDHIALCTGAGQPKFQVLENSFAKGVRTASEFLMTLHSGGAFLKNSFNNMIIRLPIAIIGCGLTAVDSAIEALNYYPVQVEKFLKHYELSVEKLGKTKVEETWTAEDKLIAEEFITHAILFRKQKSLKDIREIVESLGGATIYYRGKLTDSPAYRLNSEELIHAIAQSVKIVEYITPKKINIDKYGYCESIDFGEQIFPAKTILMAIGTEEKLLSNIDKDQYSYFGDADPKFAGSVVKALASTKTGYKSISNNLFKHLPNFSGSSEEFFSKVDDLFQSIIKEVNILSSSIVELIIYSPIAARNFQPGQFFRLQNYSDDLHRLMEPIALTGAYVDRQKGLISLIIIETGKSSGLARELKIGEKIVLMGPTGEPTKILKDKNVILIGGGLGNAVLFSIGKALKENGCKVIYIAGYKQDKDRFYPEKIEESADKVIWCCEEKILPKNRIQDISVQGDVIEGLKEYYSQLQISPDQIICIGSAEMMEAVKNIKKQLFSQECKLICSINSPMQCMMKGICGQCIQKTSSGYIYSCAYQDQDGEIVDFEVLKLRLKQNSVQEKLAQI